MAVPYKTQRFGRSLEPKLRKCNTCGYTSIRRTNSHKVWCKEQKRMVYCGTMRVVRDE